MWTRRRVLAFWLLIAAFLIANYVIVTVLAPSSGDDRGPASKAHPAVSAAECRRALRQLGNDVLHAITNREPGASGAAAPADSADPGAMPTPADSADPGAVPTPADSVDPSIVLSASECRPLLDAILSPEPGVSVR